jgi:hypothetical protein
MWRAVSSEGRPNVGMDADRLSQRDLTKVSAAISYRNTLYFSLIFI